MLIDAHSHLDSYKDLLESALEEITRHRIFTVSNSIDPPTYERNLEIGEMCDLVLPIFGVHPWCAPQYSDRLDELSWHSDKSPILGEIGLDFHFVEDASQYPEQLRVFEFFLRAAGEQDKIVSLRTKGAERETLDLLKRYEVKRVIVHWYSGSLHILRELVSIGAYFTVGTEVLDSKYIQEIALELPLEQLLTETDNPGGPEWLKGEPGMPLLIKDVVQALAETRGTTAEGIIENVQSNFLRLVGDDPRLVEIAKTIGD